MKCSSNKHTRKIYLNTMPTLYILPLRTSGVSFIFSCSQKKKYIIDFTPRTSRIFLNCSRFVDLKVNQKNCRFDSCRNGPCPSLEQAAEECKKAGFCINWRNLTGGSCGEHLIPSPDVSWLSLAPCLLNCFFFFFIRRDVSQGLSFWRVPGQAGRLLLRRVSRINSHCPQHLLCWLSNHFLFPFSCWRLLHPGPPLDSKSSGCFCPSGQFREGNHSHTCVSQCPCK